MEQGNGSNKLIIFGLFIASALLIVIGPQLMAKNGGEKDMPKEMAAQNKLPESKLPLFVEFYSDTCPICAELKPIIETVEKEFEGKVKVVKINSSLDENQLLVYDFKVSGLPAMFVLPDGKKVAGMMVGFIPADQLREVFKMLANKESFNTEKKADAEKPQS